MMGAGKSTVGRLLARRLKLRFIDCDIEIERGCGVTVPLIFEIEGEAGLRARESEVLEELTTLQNVVLATGGGAVLDAANRRRLAAGGTVVYLCAEPEALYERVRQDRNRPLLATGDPLARLRELYVKRDPLYREVAHLVVRDRTHDRPGAGAHHPRPARPPMESLSVALGSRSYPIHIGAGILGRADLYAPYLAGSAAIVTNSVVAPLYLERARKALGAARVCEVVVDDGEQGQGLVGAGSNF